LNEYSNQLGDYLRTSYEINPDDLVGIQLDRSEWMIVSILGILKSGGAYVPIDSEYPQERIDYIVEDSNCKVLLDEEELELFKIQRSRYSKVNQQINLLPSNLIYCIYTSGSTGLPKGVLIEHNMLVHSTLAREIVYKDIQKIGLLLYSFSFDSSVNLLYRLLTTGKKLVIYPSSKVDLSIVSNIIEKEKIDTLTIPPSLYEYLLDYDNISSLLSVIVAGEELKPSILIKHHALLPNTELFNEYGPTECVVWCTVKKINFSDEFVTIGKPVPGYEVFLLDNKNRLVPHGAVGEICVGGPSVGRCYLNNPDATKLKFIDNPYNRNNRIYKTGDIGRWRDDGNLEYLGRNDNQVKIRGYRIELVEIEKALEEHEKISTAIVVAKILSGNEKELVAYIIGDVEALELKSFLKEKLPIFMVPNYYIELKEIPLNNNLKVDYDKLPIPILKSMEFDNAITYTESLLLDIWSRVLGVNIDQISASYNFFDLGGQSIKAIKILALIYKEFGVRLSISSLFDGGNIRNQAYLIDSSSANIIEEGYKEINL